MMSNERKTQCEDYSRECREKCKRKMITLKYAGLAFKSN